MGHHEVQLITYADRLAGDLPGLQRLLTSPDFDGVFGGVHILPCYTPFDGADAGFDPVDHTTIDPRLGTWNDVGDIAETHTVMVDLIVNHVSSDSAAFRDVVARGDASPHAPMFLTMSSVFPDGATEAELARIYRPRPGMPFTALKLGDELRFVWTTFTPQQIDIDIFSEPGKAYLDSILDAVAGAGVKLVRLDAVGYAVKKAGTTCFMIPETFEWIDQFTQQARAKGVEVLVEVHSYYQRQVEIARAVDLVYDFALPPLILHAFYAADPSALANWLTVRPTNAVNVLDTHDGIGVIDVGPDQTVRPGEEPRPGLLTPEQIDALVEGIHASSGGSSAQATGAAASNLDLYQVNCTFYDALARDDRRYLAARAIQLFTPGIPQIYYVGALAGGNDMELLARSGVGRDINRHHYTAEELASEVQRPVVQSLFDLCRFRNSFPAFDGDLETFVDASVLTMVRAHGDASATLRVDLSTGEASIEWADGAASGGTEDLLENPPHA